jgi:zinc transport system ATP-binding protein
MDCHPIVEFVKVSFSYDGVLVLREVSLHMHEREFVWIVGPNGGGKTTLLKLMLGLLTPSQGEVRVFGGPAKNGRRRIGYMPQNLSLDTRYPVTALDVVLMGRLGNGSGLGFYSRNDRLTALECLEQVGLAAQARQPFSSLSGGQQRRLFIARALAVKPELLVLDEPTVNLDPLVQADLYRLLQELNSKLAVVMVSHDPAFVAEQVRQVVCVNQTVHVHPTGELPKDVLGALYGQRDGRIVRHDLHRGADRHD